MDRRLKRTQRILAVLCAAAPLLGACTETPETQLSWGVNDHLGRPYHPATRQARTYVYQADGRTSAPQAKPRPAPTAVVQKAKLPPLGRDERAPVFDWPANGKVISSFGTASQGERNDGINIEVKQGTPIRAAASGTVSYSGDELKDYGNLLLIRHDGGYVTAYAHAEKLLVRRGDAVTQGQVIAYAGRSGDVSTPQLHFEIRKGTTPVDPDTLLSPRSS